MQANYVIVGAGVTGVAVARALLRRRPRARVVVVEKAASVAAHTSGRNSGVAHGGYNLKPGSLKARFCVEGNRRLRSLCAERGLGCRPVGVLVVARDETEEQTLETLYDRGNENGVPDLLLLDRHGLRRREPHAVGTAALLAPSVAAVDSRGVVAALQQEAQEGGAQFLFGRRVAQVTQSGAGYELVLECCGTSQNEQAVAERETIRCDYLVNAAGAFSEKLAQQVGAGAGYTVLPFRGEYYITTPQRRAHVQHMVYPVPDLRFPFLGIHWTPTHDGELLIGPNVVLAGGREAYGRFDWSAEDVWNYGTSKAFWRLATQRTFRRYAWRLARTSFSRRAFLREAASLVKGLHLEDLRPGPPPGIRAQLATAQGELVQDLVLERQERALHVLNVVSPGLTCALPFADHLVDQIVEAA